MSANTNLTLRKTAFTSVIERLENISSGSDAYGPMVFLTAIDTEEVRPFVACGRWTAEDVGVEGSMAEVLRELLDGSCPLEILRELELAAICTETKSLLLDRCVLEMSEAFAFVDRVGSACVRHVAFTFGTKYITFTHKISRNVLNPKSARFLFFDNYLTKTFNAFDRIVPSFDAFSEVSPAVLNVSWTCPVASVTCPPTSAPATGSPDSPSMTWKVAFWPGFTAVGPERSKNAGDVERIESPKDFLTWPNFLLTSSD